MSVVPKAVSRAANRAVLKLNKNSPTILVVSGIVGFGVTAVMAAKASRKADGVVALHRRNRLELESIHTEEHTSEHDKSRDVTRLYVGTTVDLAKVYGPTIVVGTLSATAILSGHKILKGRYVGALAAYSGLFEQFQYYRQRVSNAIGQENEKNLYEGASLEWQEDPNHKGEFKLGTRFPSEIGEPAYYRAWFDETNVNWTKDPLWNYNFLKGVQAHSNHLLIARGHVFLNDVRDALGLGRIPEGQVAGWIYGGNGDDYIDFGFITSEDPHSVAFRNGFETNVQLHFNVDGSIWDKI